MRAARGGPKEDAMRRIAGVAMGTQARGNRPGAASDKAAQCLRQKNPG